MYLFCCYVTIVVEEHCHLTLLRQPLSANTVVVLTQNGQILFIRLHWTNWQVWTRARVFVQLSKSSQAHPIRKKTTCWFWKIFYMMKNKSNFPNKKVGSAF